MRGALQGPFRGSVRSKLSFFSSYTSVKTTCCSRLKIDTNMRIQSPPIKPNIKEICQNINQCCENQMFFVRKLVIFHKNALLLYYFTMPWVLKNESINIF